MTRSSQRRSAHARTPCVYILASRRNGTLYTGVTSDLVRRVREHGNDLVAGFSQRYRTHLLVWFERHETMESAIVGEKRLKEWRRAWKLELIEAENPVWWDLHWEILWGCDVSPPTAPAADPPGFRLSPE